MGLFTIQLAKLMGYKVVTTCSSRNFDLVKSYGADEVVDYKDGDAAINKIKEITGGGVHKGLDCISLPESNAFSLKCFKEGKGQLSCLLPPDEAAVKSRPDVKVADTLLYTLWGEAFTLNPRGGKKIEFPAMPHELKFHEELVERIPGILELGFKAPPIEVRGGLNDISQGLNDMRDGKLSGKRYVYTIE